MSYDCCDCFRPCTQASQHGRDQTGWLRHQTTFQLTGETNSSWCIVGHVTAEVLFCLFWIVPAEIFVCGESLLYFIVMQTVFWFITVVEFCTSKLGSFVLFVVFSLPLDLYCAYACSMHPIVFVCLCFDFFCSSDWWDTLSLPSSERWRWMTSFFGPELFIPHPCRWWSKSPLFGSDCNSWSVNNLIVQCRHFLSLIVPSLFISHSWSVNNLDCPVPFTHHSLIIQSCSLITCIYGCKVVHSSLVFTERPPQPRQHEWAWQNASDAWEQDAHDQLAGYAWRCLLLCHRCHKVCELAGC